MLVSRIEVCYIRSTIHYLSTNKKDGWGSFRGVVSLNWKSKDYSI